tara:strand:+ start:70 stop:372 length:303 start_codon:yes stop_codon:yes gene_type:complete
MTKKEITEITTKELEKACEDALGKVAEKDKTLLSQLKNAKPKKKKPAKKDAALERVERVLDRVKDNEELLRVTVELTKELKTIVLEMQNKMKMINSRLGL